MGEGGEWWGQSPGLVQGGAARAGSQSAPRWSEYLYKHWPTPTQVTISYLRHLPLTLSESYIQVFR